MKKVALISLGCAKNLIDSENMIALIKDANHTFMNNPEEADIIIINTCGFIGDAKEESINTILEMAQYKKGGKCEVLIVVGCLVQKYHEELHKELPEVDIFLGTTAYEEIMNAVNEFIQNKNYIVKVNNDFKEYIELPRHVSTPSHYAYLRIAEGCDNNCTYCIIPQFRGPYRSRKKDNILKEAEELVNSGVKELLIIAEDITQYGIDLYSDYNLVSLLKDLVKINDLRWVRLLYCYPNNFTDELIEVIRDEPKICKYVDIPLQHSDDNILRKMGRQITENEIRSLLTKIRNKIPEMIIRSTFIVGFPGEEQKNFDNLMKFLEDMKLDRVGAFTYSQEESTPAAKLPRQIDGDVKEERKRRLMELQHDILIEKHDLLRNKIISVQVDECHPERENLWICRSEGEAPEIDPVIMVYSEKTLTLGELIKVKITHLQDYDLIGEVDYELT
ncbi:SSU ribosomal protein S12P methylthiotransferase [Desulfonispora thiosulfatigenes DSM 11270]|uniref:Ribosomal protein uS12 methylthiotransferase RimO n=1 Tax=Desulfonispora thiosulfatigenes DSM 11270 TaxID=656914 RepID=A0A1W1VSI2_DESTI|nr:30S ribosomal protein S12 methylthiotransferase RimO [Desulfonispora thiosulfatigenes]SMB96296.1 SSU ribosomal protein S12P methylthiotransferase [Desulfonispora thiosulfatigenes DSM 11270]